MNSRTPHPNLRQRNVLEKKKTVQRCCRAHETQQPLELLSGMFNDVLLVLDDISGDRKREDLYDHIFSQFCIGK